MFGKKLFKSMLSLILSVVLLLPMLLSPISVHADSGDGLSLDGRTSLIVSGYTKENDGIKLDLGSNYDGYIRLLTPTMSKVSVLKKGEAEYTSPGIAKKDWNTPNFTVSESDNVYLLATDKINIYINKKPFGVKYTDKQGNVINEDALDKGSGYDNNGKPFLYKKLDPSDKESFYGFGERTGNLNKYGDKMTLWNTDAYGYTNSTDSLYTSIPFFIGLKDQKAYGIFFDNTYKSHFDMGKESDGYYYFYADGGKLTYYFIYGPKIQDVLDTYTDLTGKMNKPPLWSLGFQQSKYGYTPEELLNVAQTYRDKKIPLDTMVFDINYMNGYRVFTWDTQYKKVLRTLKGEGFRAVTIVDPGVKADNNYSVYYDGIKNNYFAKNPDGSVFHGTVWPGDSVFPDFSREEVRNWWGNNQSALLNAGVDGIWNDMNEPSIFNGPGGTAPLDVVFGDQTSAEFHNIFAHEENHAAYDGYLRLKPNQRPFILTRDMYAGTQRYAAIWTGDNQSDWEHLAMSIPMNGNIGLSGQPFVGNDIGGFAGPRATPDLFARWIEVGSLVPFARDHYSIDKKDQEPWQFGKQVEDISRKYISLRYQLLPYLYNAFITASETGAPVQQPLVYQFQNDGNTYNINDQFMLGNNIMVAPVVSEGKTSRKVYLPEGANWIDYWTGKFYNGGQTITRDADLGTMPIYVKDDSIIPTRDVQQSTEEKPLTNLILDTYLSSGAQSTFYEDDGETFNDQKGAYNTTQFDLKKNGDTITFTQNKTKQGYDSKIKSYTLKLHGTTEPYSITAGGTSFTKEKNVNDLDQDQRGYYFDSDSSTLYVRIPASEDQNVQIVIASSVEEAKAAVAKAETSKSQSEVDAAQTLVERLADAQVKADLSSKLKAVQQAIDTAKAEQAATVVVEKAETSKSQPDVDAANTLVEKLTAGDVKTNLLKRLDAIQELIAEGTATSAVVKAESNRLQSDLNDARALVDKLANGSVKNSLSDRLDTVQQLINKQAKDRFIAATTAVEKAESSKSQKDVDAAQTLVNRLPSGSLKTELLWHLSMVQLTIDKKAKHDKAASFTGYLTQKQAVRVGASTKARKVATLPKGAAVKGQKSGTWIKISYKGAIRYVWSKNINKSLFTGKLTKKHTLYSAASKKSHVIRNLKKNTKIIVLTKGKYYYKVVYSGKIGYVWGKDVKK
ncbi:TIM-barrel domain-containing protein [Sporolactobacillus laevolacticus]|uniref:TIM-barrel domain-containing protein n=1 Tax=Sporolactobacillus laevolacticus TaxID=33018 RepID=UPI0025B563AF|nr:TIM-barrel domain-containing protein [Sporolactobacillus laevolacticus]MDN3954898.1 glycoside hydrolase family 31 protein [Sporolactobacillus laevolacticus]